MLKGDGFLGSGATLGADVTLLANVILLVPLMVIGYRYARGEKFSSHKIIMTSVTLLNWALIGLVMGVSMKEQVLSGIPDLLGRPFFLSPTIHALVGGSGQVLATYLVLRMWLENVLPGFLLVTNIKPLMRLTLGLWFLAAILGIATYIFWYLMA
jgi:uncharacterized membrane protein YozB (DUF420 family)